MCVACNAAPVPRDGSLTQLAFLDTLPPDWLPVCDVPLFLLHKAPPAQAEAHCPFPVLDPAVLSMHCHGPWRARMTVARPLLCLNAASLLPRE